MQATYRYNAEGVRSSKIVKGLRTDYIYSGNRLLAWRDIDGWHENIYLNGEIIATVENGKIYYHENDYQGKALRLVDTKGKIVWKSDWQPYRESDTTRNSVNNLQRFAGQILDKETGLYYNHFREYDPQTGRYTQSDPIGLNGGVNTYAYVGGNPVNWVDPEGEIAWFGIPVVIGLYFGTADVAQAPTVPNDIQYPSLGDRMILCSPISTTASRFTGGISDYINPKRLFKKLGKKSAKGLIGKDFENYLEKKLGGRGSFKAKGREFDGAVGNRWYEAKSGNYWRDHVQPNSKGFSKFKSDMGRRQHIATEHGKTYELHSR